MRFSSAIYFRYIEDDFEEIENHREFTLDCLYGNMGGYIGMILGYSLIQTADAISLLLTWIFNNVPGTRN